jgi:hypothetical protein
MVQLIFLGLLVTTPPPKLERYSSSSLIRVECSIYHILAELSWIEATGAEAHFVQLDYVKHEPCVSRREMMVQECIAAVLCNTIESVTQLSFCQMG